MSKAGKSSRKGAGHRHGEPCAFCQGAGRKNKEHAIPQWISRSLGGTGPGSFHGYRAVTIPPYRTTDGTIVNQWAVREDQPVKTVNVVTRQVCQGCNGGWMNRLEDDVKPILVPLITGQVRELPPADMWVLAAWATKTAMALALASYLPAGPAEGSVERRPTMPRGAMHELYLTQAPLQKSQVYLGLAEGPPVPAKAVVGYFMGRQDGYTRAGVAIEMHWVTLRLNEVGVKFVYWTGPRELRLADTALGREVRRIWPNGGKSLRWPPAFAFSNELFDLWSTNGPAVWHQ